MRELSRGLLASLWMVVLTAPLLVVRVNTTDKVVTWRWGNMLWMAIGSLLLFLAWRWAMARRGGDVQAADQDSWFDKLLARIGQGPLRLPVILGLVLVALVLPLFVSMYEMDIYARALIYVGLGLGLNIVVGMAGLLNLGYAAFFAVGSYTYALLNHHYALDFWLALPLGGLFAALFGVILALPVLRLRGDYLAIVTLGFGEIVRLVLQNWDSFSFGPSGIANIARPTLFGREFGVQDSAIFIYYISLALVAVVIFVTKRFQDSRVGRALLALREDEIACEAMGIDKTGVKVMAFALGASFAGVFGVVFAAKQAFINPDSFTFIESAMILSIVVLGGMGSIVGVAIAAIILQLMPEYFRFMADYRMLIFGAALVLMMLFRPEGLVRAKREHYTVKDLSPQTEDT
jgi:branched-chain amino acid transport system permease protein